MKDSIVYTVRNSYGVFKTNKYNISTKWAMGCEQPARLRFEVTAVRWLGPRDVSRTERAAREAYITPSVPGIQAIVVRVFIEIGYVVLA